MKAMRVEVRDDLPLKTIKYGHIMKEYESTQNQAGYGCRTTHSFQTSFNGYLLIGLISTHM